MGISRLKQRKTAIATATVAAALASGVAYAAIPDQQGVISSCYDSQGYVRVIDAATTSACPTGTSKLQWGQQGRTGPTGMRGPQGQPGPNNLHWVKVNAAGTTTGVSDSATSTYNGPGYTYFSIPNVDPSKCAITVQAANALFSDGPITTSYQLYSSYVYARAQQLHPNGTVDYYPKTGLDVMVAC
ncbi:MAG: hypothetical protein QOI80_3773 [Solirubrobacteraceae bacterium]|jgi:hypothetical protein|nr:hypothetical protein [Solirubrobacteraceae bacterium]